jgi:hypothetical protein
MRIRFCHLVWGATLPLLVLACSGPQDDSRLGAPGSQGTASAPQTTGSAGAAPSTAVTVQPAVTGVTTGHGGETTSEGETRPTLESCQALGKPAGKSCHWALVAYPWCGGVRPPPEALWPRCSCEACGVDADCAAGQRCAMLPTDTDCHPPKMICLGPKSACSDKGGCKQGELCMWINGNATCKVPTPYERHP